MQFAVRAEQYPVATLGERGFPSPLRRATDDSPGGFVEDCEWVLYEGTVRLEGSLETSDRLFERAGPREALFFNPAETVAAVVTCGGLCPGLNDVIRSLYLELHHNYNVPKMLGIRNGYLGLNPLQGPAPVVLNADFIEDIQFLGGTVLGTSRGPQDVPMMVDFLQQLGVKVLFCVGGDGTQRGAHALVEEIGRRDLKIAVVGIPKTIDNDILYCDRSFGVVTAIEKAREVIIQAHTEAKAAINGVGLVKLMGRDAGFIACGATLTSQEVNFTLIPEVPFELHGDHALLAALWRRLKARSHAVIAVAEGAGQQFFKDSPVAYDASGNRLQHDIGTFLKDEIGCYFKALREPVNIRYIDPSYIIRSVPANSDDRLLCDQLARHAVHAAMAGKTDVLVCYKNAKFMHVPISMASSQKQRVDPQGELWAAVLASTGQPAHFPGDAE